MALHLGVWQHPNALRRDGFQDFLHPPEFRPGRSPLHAIRLYRMDFDPTVESKRPDASTAAGSFSFVCCYLMSFPITRIASSNASARTTSAPVMVAPLWAVGLPVPEARVGPVALAAPGPGSGATTTDTSRVPSKRAFPGGLCGQTPQSAGGGFAAFALLHPQNP